MSLAAALGQSGLALAATGLWLALALILLRLAGRRHPGLLWLLALAGVPVLGWLTLHWGPGPGFAGFALGLIVLARCAPRRPPAAGDQPQPDRS